MTDEERRLNKAHEGLTANAPDWSKPENRLDGNKNKPGHKDFDPATLEIPEKEFKKLKPMLKQFWGCKKNHMDKIVLFQFGDWIQGFYNDAFILHKELDVTYNTKWNMAGFHKSKFEATVNELVKRGYKVVYLAQVGLGKDVERKLKRDGKAEEELKEDGIIKREVKAIYTPATLETAFTYSS